MIIKVSKCSCGKEGKFKREGICSACYKEDTRVYDPDKQKKYFDKWYATQKVNGYPSYNWKLRNEKQARAKITTFTPE